MDCVNVDVPCKDCEIKDDCKYYEDERFKKILLCVCDCGGDVISRHNGNVGFCEKCNNMYQKIEKKGR